MDPPASHGVSRAPCYSGTLIITEGNRFCLQDYHLLWLAFPHHFASDLLCNFHMPGPTTPQQQAAAVWAVPISLATTLGIISFPLGTKMFQFPRFPSHNLYIQLWIPLVCNGGFPHSEISGSKPVHDSPKLIAVTHVLHRHLAPRHPP